MIAMIGTSDRLCWLAETCKILLLLLLGHLKWSTRGRSVDGHVQYCTGYCSTVLVTVVPVQL